MNQLTHTSDHLDAQTISVFIDSELSPAEHQQTRQHLTACHDCALRVVAAAQLKTATARAGRRFVPPPESFAHITAQLRSSETEVNTPKRRYPVRMMAWSAIAAALLLAVSLLGWN
jgi:anti-sigma factor RsiW